MTSPSLWGSGLHSSIIWQLMYLTVLFIYFVRLHYCMTERLHNWKIAPSFMTLGTAPWIFHLFYFWPENCLYMWITCLFPVTNESCHDTMFKLPGNNRLQKSSCNPLYVQGCQTKIMMGLVSLYFLLRLRQLEFTNSLIEMVRQILPCMVQNFGEASLRFACVSNPLNKPRPLQLDVSFPLFQDIKWSFARLLYLLNIQLEKNVST